MIDYHQSQILSRGNDVSPPFSKEVPRGNEQNFTGQKARQRPASPPCSSLRSTDPFGIDNPSEMESSENSLSTISPSFIRKFSRIYKWLRRIDSPSCSIRVGANNGNEETSNRDNNIQRTPSSPSRDEGAKRRKLKGRLVILLTFIVLCVVISGVAFAIFAIYKFTQQDNMQIVTGKLTEVSDGEQVFSGLLKINETFSYEMADTNSPKFRSFEERFFSNIESVLTRNVSSGRCKVNSLSNGSIIVNFTLVISDQRFANETRDLLLCLFNGTQVGAMAVDSQATQFIFNPDANETIVSKELKSSTCSSASLPILPMNYTYPDYCGDYQVCIQGTSVLKTCPQGQEFAYLSQDDSKICTLPSENTYCGRKKLVMKNIAHVCNWGVFSLCSGILIALTLSDLNV